MAEVLVHFTEPVLGSDGRLYEAQACGTVAPDGLWEGWIEFISSAGVVRTERETSQPNHADLMYWAQGLTHTYLQGALSRALGGPVVVPSEVYVESVFPGPASPPPRGIPPHAPHAILDPFAVFTQGEHVLRRQLLALSPDQLSNVILAYRLGDPVSDLASVAELTRRVDEIVAVVRDRARAA